MADVSAWAARVGGYTHWIVGPWLKQGGSDLGILHHARALTTNGAKPLVLLTEPVDSPWLDRLPPSVTAIEFGRETPDLSVEERIALFTGMMVQAPPRVLHVTHSLVAWEALRRRGADLRQKTRLFASLYCDDYSPEGVLRGYAHRYLSLCQPHLTQVICDSAAYPAKLARERGYSPDLFATVYFPTEIPDIVPPRPPTVQRTILWAGRFDRQKRLDLVAKIAEAMPDCRFLIYGTIVLGADQAALDALGLLPNVEMRGIYKGFGSLPVSEADLFLYTSQWDGMPNVVLESAAHGLPIVASSVGGIPELIGQDKGYLVEPFDDVAGYVAAITRILDHPDEAQERAVNALALVRARHDFGAFLEAMKSLKDYVR